MGDHQNGGALLVQGTEQFHHFLAMNGIQVAGRFVGQDQRLVADHCAGNRYALLLPAGQLARSVLGAVRHAHAIHHLGNLLLALAGGHLVVEQGQLDVLGHRQFVDQVEALENEADVLLADRTEALLGVTGNVFVEKPVIAATATNSPWSTSKLTPFRATVSTSSVRYTLYRSCIFSIAFFLCQASSRTSRSRPV